MFSTSQVCVTTTYTITLSPALTSGTHTITSTVTPSGGLESSSSPALSIIIDTTNPVAPILTTPTTLSSTTDMTPTISGTGEPNNTITITVDPDNNAGTTNSFVITTTADAFGSFSIDVPNLNAITVGNTTKITAIQTDEAGNVSSATTPVLVTIIAPTPNVPIITSPLTGTATNNITPTISGTGTVGATLTVFEGATTICTATVAGAGTWSCVATPALAVGLHTFVATQAVAFSPSSAPSAAVLLTIDTIAPVAPVVTGPTGFVGTSIPIVSGAGEMGSIVTVTVDPDNNAGTANSFVMTAIVQPNTTWSATVPAGNAIPNLATASATAIQTDPAGNISPQSNTITFTVSLAPVPAPTVTSPTPSSSISNTTPSITGTGIPGASIAVSIDGLVITCVGAPIIVNVSGVWSCTPTVALTQTVHSLTTTQTTSSLSSPSAPVLFSIDTTAPAAPVIISPSAASIVNTANPTFSGTGEAGSTVTVYDGATAICTAVSTLR